MLIQFCDDGDESCGHVKVRYFFFTFFHKREQISALLSPCCLCVRFIFLNKSDRLWLCEHYAITGHPKDIISYILY